MPGKKVPLKAYIDALFAERASHFADLRDAQLQAISAALAANEKRLDSMNEFRATLKDQQGMFVTRTELFAWIGVAAAVGALAGHLWR